MLQSEFDGIELSYHFFVWIFLLWNAKDEGWFHLIPPFPQIEWGEKEVFDGMHSIFLSKNKRTYYHSIHFHHSKHNLNVTDINKSQQCKPRPVL